MVTLMVKTIKISKMEPIFEEKLRAFGYKYGYDLNIKERLNHIQGSEKAYPGKDMTFIGAK